MIQKELLVVGDEEVLLDPNNLKFNQDTLSLYLMKEGGWYDNFGAYLAKAEKDLQIKETEYDNLYNLRFYQLKDEGKSDKMAEAGAKLDADLLKLAKEKGQAKYMVSRLKYHLRAWDKNHDNAQSMGHTLRREMDRFGNDICSRNTAAGVFDDVDAIVQHLNPDDMESGS